MKTLKFFGLISIVLAVGIIMAWQSPDVPKPHEGYLRVDGGRVWYRIVGEGPKTPILVLHGGPGAPSYYLKSLGALAKDRSVIFFDQLGCGKSDRITDIKLMTLDHYVSEVGEVIRQLGLKKYYIFGHSWGTILATDYYLEHPKGIQGMILSGAPLSMPMYVKGAEDLIATLPDSVQQAIRVNERDKTYDTPAYQQAVEVFYKNFLAKKLPWSADLDSTLTQFGQNVYEFMSGPSEFTITGDLKYYDRTLRLGEIKVPTLFICGEYDEVRPSNVKYYQSLVPNSQFALIENSAHLTTQDNPEKTNEVISGFIYGIENKRATVQN